MDIFNFDYNFYIDYYNLDKNLKKEEAFKHYINLKNKNNIYFNNTHSYYYYNYDWDYYIFIYNDLNNRLKNQKEGFEHFMKKGLNEKREIFKIEEDNINYILNYNLFNWKEYLMLNIDLKKINKEKKYFIEHFIIYGYKESRIFSKNYEILLNSIKNKYPIEMNNIYFNNILKKINNEIPYHKIKYDIERFKIIYNKVIQILNKFFNKDVKLLDLIINDKEINNFNYKGYERIKSKNTINIIDSNNYLINKNYLIKKLNNINNNLILLNNSYINIVITNINDKINIEPIEYNLNYESKIINEYKNKFLDKRLLSNENYKLYLKYNWKLIIETLKLEGDLITIIDNYNKNNLQIKNINLRKKHNYFLKFNQLFHNEENTINQKYPHTYIHYLIYYLFDWDKIITVHNENNLKYQINEDKDTFFYKYINQFKKYKLKLYFNKKEILDYNILNKSFINILFLDITLLQNIIKWNFLYNDMLFLKNLTLFENTINDILEYKINFLYKPLFFNNILQLNKNDIVNVDKDIKFSFIISSYNNERNIKDNIYSIIYQNYRNWDIFYTNDNSTDKTEEILMNIINEFDLSDKIIYIKNNENLKQAHNKYYMYQITNKNNILCILDGDDWLSQNNVLLEINKTYTKKKCLMLYTGYKILYNNKIEYISGMMEYSNEIKNNGDYRKDKNWLFGHIRTGYAWLYKMIPKSYMIYNDKWLDRCTDMAENYCISEIAKNKLENIKKALVIYNKNNSMLYETSYYIDAYSKKRKEIEEYVKSREKLELIIPDFYIIQKNIKNIKKTNNQYHFIEEIKNQELNKDILKIENLLVLFKQLIQNKNLNHYLIIYSNNYKILKNKEYKLCLTQIFLNECDFLIIDNHLELVNNELYNHINIKQELSNYQFDEIKSFIISRKYIDFILNKGLNYFIEFNINWNDFIKSCINNTLENDLNLYVLTDPIVYY